MRDMGFGAVILPDGTSYECTSYTDWFAVYWQDQWKNLFPYFAIKTKEQIVEEYGKFLVNFKKEMKEHFASGGCWPWPGYPLCNCCGTTWLGFWSYHRGSRDFYLCWKCYCDYYKQNLSMLEFVLHARKFI
jgi:hypothetical protein